MTTQPAQNGPTVGDALQKARHRIGFSVDGAAAAASITVRELGNIESGMKIPDPDVLKALARIYGVDHNRFGAGRWVPRVPPRYDADASILWMGYVSIAFDQAIHDNDYLLRAMGGAIRTMRSMDSTKPVYLRSNELPLIATLLDMADPELPQLLGYHLNHDSVHVDWLLEQLREAAPASRVLAEA